MTSAVRELNLSETGLNAQGAGAIGQALRVNAHLQLLDLSKNDLYRGVLAIASALDENQCLTSLNLADSSLGQDDLGHFLEPMKVNKTLLDLQAPSEAANANQ